GPPRRPQARHRRPGPDAQGDRAAGGGDAGAAVKLPWRARRSPSAPPQRASRHLTPLPASEEGRGRESGPSFSIPPLPVRGGGRGTGERAFIFDSPSPGEGGGRGTGEGVRG